MTKTIATEAAQIAVPSERTTKTYGLPRVHEGHRRASVQRRCVAHAQRTVAAITAEVLRERATAARDAGTIARQVSRGVVPVGASSPRARRRATRRATRRVTRRGCARGTGCDAPGDA